MFAMVVLFGLFHGLIFVPVLLSIVGPTPTEENSEGSSSSKYKTSQQRQQAEEEGSPRSQTKFPMA